MPVSVKRADQSAGGGGIQEGMIRVIDANYVIHQFEKDGKPVGNMGTMAKLNAHMLDNDSEPSGEPDDIFYSCGFGIDFLQPGDENDNPAGKGELGDSDKYLVAIKEGSTLRANEDWAVFCQELENCGWDPDEIKDDISFLVGAEMHLRKHTVKRKSGKDWSFPVPDKVTVFPYKANKKGAAKKGAAAAKPAAAGAGKKPAAKPAVEENEGETDAETLGAACEFLATVIETRKAKGELNLKGLALQCTLLKAKIPAEHRDGVVAMLKDAAQVANVVETMDAGVTFDGDTLTWDANA